MPVELTNSSKAIVATALEVADRHQTSAYYISPADRMGVSANLKADRIGETSGL
jgi:hypothetical protein